MTDEMERPSRAGGQAVLERVSGGSGKLLELVEIIADPEGTAEVRIPPPCLWDCVDCFGENRLEATFTFKPPDFVARVRHASPTRVHEVLGNWHAQLPVGEPGFCRAGI